MADNPRCTTSDDCRLSLCPPATGNYPAAHEVCQRENDNDQGLYRRMRVRRGPIPSERTVDLRKPLPMRPLPEKKRHRSRFLSDVSVAGRGEDHRYSKGLARCG